MPSTHVFNRSQIALQTYTPSTGSISGINESNVTLRYVADSMPNFSEISALFSQMKILKVRETWTYRSPEDTSSATPPIMYLYRDKTDANNLTLAEIQERKHRVFTFTDSRPTVSFNIPLYAQEAVGAQDPIASSSGTRPVWSPWLLLDTTATPNLSLGSMKMVITGDNVAYNFQRNVHITFACKGVQ